MRTILICEETLRKLLHEFDRNGVATIHLDPATSEPICLVVMAHHEKHEHVGVIS